MGFEQLLLHCYELQMDFKDKLCRPLTHSVPYVSLFLEGQSISLVVV